VSPKQGAASCAKLEGVRLGRPREYFFDFRPVRRQFFEKLGVSPDDKAKSFD
jgi:hypothetical protein